MHVAVHAHETRMIERVTLRLAPPIESQVETLARYALLAISSGDALRANASALRRLLKPPLVDTVALRREIAAAVIDREGYIWAN